MARVPNPFYNDLPKAWRTEEAKLVKISSEAFHIGSLIIKNGRAKERLYQLMRDEDTLNFRRRTLQTTIDDANVRAWSLKKAKAGEVTESQIQEKFRSVRLSRQQLGLLTKQIDLISEVRLYLQSVTEELPTPPLQSKSESSAEFPSTPITTESTVSKPLKRRFIED